MKFTDEQLFLVKQDKELSSIGWIQSIINRLECAEVIAADHASIYPKDVAVKAWLESKGEKQEDQNGN